MKKEWATIKNHTNYLVSNCGDVKNRTTGKLLSPKTNGRSKTQYVLLINDKGFVKYKTITHLVVEHFTSEKNLKYKRFQYRDSNPKNNNINNIIVSSGSKITKSELMELVK